MALLDQTIAKMTAKKPGSSGDQNAHLRFLAHQDHEGNPIHRNLTENKAWNERSNHELLPFSQQMKSIDCKPSIFIIRAVTIFFLFPTISRPMALGLDPDAYQGDQPPASQLGFFGQIHLQQDQMPSQARGEQN